MPTAKPFRIYSVGEYTNIKIYEIVVNSASATFEATTVFGDDLPLDTHLVGERIEGYFNYINVTSGEIRVYSINEIL